MKKNRIRLYCILLTGFLLLNTVSFATGTTYAHPGNMVTSLAVLTTAAKEITSNCLITETEVPRTVLLGEADLENLSEVEIPFWLLSSGTDTNLKLNWYLSEEVPEEYFEIALTVKDDSEEGEKVLEPGTEINLLKDTRQELVLCVEPTECAKENAHDEMTVEVYVTAGDTMKGTFQIILPEVEAEESEEPTDPENPTDQGTPTDPDDSTDTENATDQDTETDLEESTDSETPTESNNSEPALTLSSLMTFTKPVELTGVSDPTEPGESEKTTESEINTTTETTIETKTTTENESESTVEEPSAKLETLPAFDITQQLPVVMNLEGTATSVRLGVQEKKDENVTFKELPDYTMFSVDGGESYFMVYGDYIPELVPEGEKMPLLLDFRYTNLTQDEELNLAMEIYVDGQLQTTCTAVTTASVNRDWQSGPILNFENTLEFSFPEEWKDAELTYTVEHLTMTEEQVLQYVPAEFSEDGLQAIYEKQENNHRLVLSLGQKFTQPGTYRLRISWNYEGLCYDSTQTNFFVNCSGWVAPEVSGLEVSNDE